MFLPGAPGHLSHCNAPVSKTNLQSHGVVLPTTVSSPTDPAPSARIPLPRPDGLRRPLRYVPNSRQAVPVISLANTFKSLI